MWTVITFPPTLLVFYKPGLTLEQRALQKQAGASYVNSQCFGFTQSLFQRVEMTVVAASQQTHRKEQVHIGLAVYKFIQHKEHLIVNPSTPKAGEVLTQRDIC